MFYFVFSAYLYQMSHLGWRARKRQLVQLQEMCLFNGDNRTAAPRRQVSSLCPLSCMNSLRGTKLRTSWLSTPTLRSREHPVPLCSRPSGAGRAEGDGGTALHALRASKHGTPGKTRNPHTTPTTNNPGCSLVLKSSPYTYSSLSRNRSLPPLGDPPTPPWGPANSAATSHAHLRCRRAH